MTRTAYRIVLSVLFVQAIVGCSGDNRPNIDRDRDSGPEVDGGDAAASECGDLRVQPGEECDDGNTDADDGCDADCQLEAGFTCLPAGGGCFECGDGTVDSTETCDDGNADAGDGCDASCQVEDGFTCLVEGEACEMCGDGVLSPSERCDEGAFADGVGCSEDCLTIQDGFQCAVPGEACAECGDGMVGAGEVCDDANTVSGDGCVETCLAVESGWACPADGGACTLCGDGVLSPESEECDDANFQSDDGCSEACRMEPGAVCLRPGLLCSVCGNGFIEFIAFDDNGTPDDTSDDVFDANDPAAREGCDDGNLANDDGCSDSCVMETGGTLPWICPVPGLGCGRCGDGVVQEIETCDDGVDDVSGLPVGSDGCSADCTAIETGYLCPATGGACVQCGNGKLDAPLEACDDGNVVSGDGCNRLCVVETDPPFKCPLPGSPCQLCGNGVQESEEACDDGNRVSDDGCNADCTAEDANYNCYIDGFPCALCGDATLQPGEQCDEGQLSTPTNLTAGCVDCQRTANWNCPSVGVPCELCGDGIIGAGDPLSAFETCDDGNTLSNDGCSAECQSEPGFVCDNTGGCLAAACGDGIAAPPEECDDGNQNAGDGCSFLCRVEPGFSCSGAAGCRRTRCGDGIVEGTEQCDDAGGLCTSAGAQNGQDCVLEVDYQACLADGGTCAPEANDGCDLACQLEDGFKCDMAGLPCTASYCGDGLVEGTEQCDVGGAVCDANGNALDGTACVVAADFDACAAVAPGTSGCVAVDANGCDTDCMLKQGFVCEDGVSCAPTDPALDCCVPTVCGDGVVEGTEECDDGMAPANGDGCADDCMVEDFYRCKPDVLTGVSVCRPIVQYVSITRFNVQNVDPIALSYDPARRSFGGHKAQDSQTSIELCLDGTVIDQGNTSGGRSNGTITDPTGAVSELPEDCTTATAGDPCYEPPLRPEEIAISKTGLGAMQGSTFDPVTGDTLFTLIYGNNVSLLVQLPAGMDPDVLVDLRKYAVKLDFDAFGITVGADGDLYVIDQDNERILVLPRIRDAAGNPLDAPDCSLVVPTATTNCTSFLASPDLTRTRLAPSDNTLDDIFTVPGESLVGIFNAYAGSPTYNGTDMADGSTVSNDNYFSFYEEGSMDAPRRSALPGVLFDLGTDGTSYSNPADATETAADGAAFIVCTETASEDCQIFSRVCEDDADCPSGTLCNLSGISSVGVAFCNSPGEARDDLFQVERDIYKECVGGTADGQDCTASDSACTTGGGTCTQTGQMLGTPLDVLANDSLSESACVDPTFTVLAICGDGVQSPYELANPTSCPTEPTPNGQPTLEPDGTVTYDPPDDGSCGFFDTFTYTVDLGGGVIDTAQVRVVVKCICGDGLTDAGEQCDDGAFNGAPGTCVQNCGSGSEVLARCGDTCFLNVLCGDTYIVSPEECDDGNTDNGDGCSSVCTRESDCGNGIPELGEDCDAGPTGSATCNPNCTIPVCGDGNLDAQKGETCDDGNLRVGDGCNASCQVETVCGNGVVEPGENCDDGGTVPGDGCSSICTVENVCGNGIREGAEVCDKTDFGSCPVVSSVQIQCINSIVGASNICLCANYCGDTKIGGAEECDSGPSGSATCRGSSPSDGLPCHLIRCGDGVIDSGEQCDDGNTNTTDACGNDCKIRGSCGNGTIEAPEECDDGNAVPGDGCSATCQTEATSCGDGTVDSDEQCDDGNTTSGDGCSSNCRVEGTVCGDGNKDPGEECDDGNTTSGDGCSSGCRFELQ